MGVDRVKRQEKVNAEVGVARKRAPVLERAERRAYERAPVQRIPEDVVVLSEIEVVSLESKVREERESRHVRAVKEGRHDDDDQPHPAARWVVPPHGGAGAIDGFEAYPQKAFE